MTTQLLAIATVVTTDVATGVAIVSAQLVLFLD